MFVSIGERMYGKVDRVPGVCYVVTKFAHINYIPLFPTGGYIVVEGSETGKEFRGKPIGVSLKSVFVGYFRVWVGLITLICMTVAGVNLFAHAAQTPVPPLAAGLVLVVGLCMGLTLIGGRVGALFQLVGHVGSGVLYFLYDGAGQGFVARDVSTGRDVLLAANVGLLLYGFTRFWDHASPARRRQLMRELGMEIPPDDAEPAHDDVRGPRDEHDHYHH